MLIILAIVFHGDDSGSSPPTTSVPVAPAGALQAHDAAGQLTLDGPVKTADEQKAIDAAAADRFGKDNVLDRLKVQATADSAAWLATAIAALPRKGSGFGAIDVTSTKTVLTVSGRVPTAAAGDALVKAIGDAAGRKVVEQAADRRRGRRGHAPGEHRRRGQRPPDLVPVRQRGDHQGRSEGTARTRKPLKAAGAARVSVGGYTDSVGDAKANLRLSLARAHSVVTFLTKHGVPAKTLVAKGYGETKPIASNSTAAGRSKNRRIEFTVLSG